MDRIARLCTYLDKCAVFADVACDHGYCAEYMLKNNLCEIAVISDISSKSLAKAEKLLSRYIDTGRCRAVVCDGLELIDSSVNQTLIAGIGGEEIIKILKNSYIPISFVFQPMKSARALRGYLLAAGCEITADDIFTDDKNYYFVIKGGIGVSAPDYSEAELEYGRDSLKNPLLREYLGDELAKKRSYLTRTMTAESRRFIEKSIAFIEAVLNNEIK